MDSVGGGKMTYSGTSTTQSGGVLYVHTGTLNLNGVIVDASNITSGGAGGALYILTNGIVNVENSQIIGAKTNAQGPAVWKSGASSMTIKDSTITGGMFNQASALKTFLYGKVELLQGDGAYGLVGSAAAAQFDCTNLAADAKLVVGNCNYKFADETAAQAAVSNGVIVPVEGKALAVSGAVVTAG